MIHINLFKKPLMSLRFFVEGTDIGESVSQVVDDQLCTCYLCHDRDSLSRFSTEICVNPAWRTYTVCLKGVDVSKLYNLMNCSLVAPDVAPVSKQLSERKRKCLISKQKSGLVQDQVLSEDLRSTQRFAFATNLQIIQTLGTSLIKLR